MKLTIEDRQFLADQIKHGNVVLFLGAGANDGSRNGRKQPIKLGFELSDLLRAATKSTDPSIDLGGLVEEFTDRFGNREFVRIMQAEFNDCTPSEQLTSLFSYAWFRLYTLNLDDAVENTPRYRRQQQFATKNRDDYIGEQRSFDTLEIVHLNGFCKNPDRGFIFTPEQYRREIRKTARWYRKCAEDKYERVFVFVGTKLEEPIFKALIEEIGRETGDYAPRSFLVGPSLPTPYVLRNLKKINVDCVEGTVSSFVQYLRDNVGDKLSPADVAALVSHTSAAPGVSAAVISSVSRIGTREWFQRSRLPDDGKRSAARDFFNGFPPSWEIVANQIPVSLVHDKVVLTQIKAFLTSKNRIFVLTGQSGSGKTTTLMKAALEIASVDRIPVYLLNERTKEKLSDIVSFVSESEPKSCILFIDQLVLFADDLLALDQALRGKDIRVVSQCRDTDFESRIVRVLPSDLQRFQLPKLSGEDYSHLCDGLNEHAVAPAFRAIKDRNKQLHFLTTSRRQLLVLMKEATQQRRFEEIIEDEFESIVREDAQAIFCVVGLSTLGKSQLGVGEVQAILNYISTEFDLGEGVRHLAGMIENKNGNLTGRHEIYVRHLFDHKIRAELLRDCLVAFLRYFSGFGQPVIPNLGRQRGNLFKFLLNSDFLSELFKRKRAIDMAESVYSTIEFEYQLDGHYWLQRGLFYRHRRQHKAALDFFGKSIEAYPGSRYVRHAFAQQQLILAALLGRPTRATENEVDAAVKELNQQNETRIVDQEYPLVTLATFHPEVLVRWGRFAAARLVAREYFERLEAFSRSLYKAVPAVDVARANCLKLASTGHWKRPKY